MSECSRSTLTPRRRLAVIAGATAAIAASAPTLLHRSGASAISDNVLEFMVGLFMGIAMVALVFTIRATRN